MDNTVEENHIKIDESFQLVFQMLDLQILKFRNKLTQVADKKKISIDILDDDNMEFYTADKKLLKCSWIMLGCYNEESMDDIKKTMVNDKDNGMLNDKDNGMLNDKDNEMLNDIVPIASADKKVYFWSWPWYFMKASDDDAVVESKLQEYVKNLPDDLSMLKQDNIYCADPMFISYLFGLLLEHFKFETIYVHVSDGVYFPFGLTNVQWSTMPEKTDEKLADAMQDLSVVKDYVNADKDASLQPQKCIFANREVNYSAKAVDTDTIDNTAYDDLSVVVDKSTTYVDDTAKVITENTVEVAEYDN